MTVMGWPDTCDTIDERHVWTYEGEDSPPPFLPCECGRRVYLINGVSRMTPTGRCPRCIEPFDSIRHRYIDDVSWVCLA